MKLSDLKCPWECDGRFRTFKAQLRSHWCLVHYCNECTEIEMWAETEQLVMEKFNSWMKK